MTRCRGRFDAEAAAQPGPAHEDTTTTSRPLNLNGE
jgi:hypothetical protein